MYSDILQCLLQKFWYIQFFYEIFEKNLVFYEKGIQLAGLHVPKDRFFLPVLF